MSRSWSATSLPFSIRVPYFSGLRSLIWLYWNGYRAWASLRVVRRPAGPNMNVTFRIPGARGDTSPAATSTGVVSPSSGTTRIFVITSGSLASRDRSSMIAGTVLPSRVKSTSCFCHNPCSDALSRATRARSRARSKSAWCSGELGEYPLIAMIWARRIGSTTPGCPASRAQNAWNMLLYRPSGPGASSSARNVSPPATKAGFDSRDTVSRSRAAAPDGSCRLSSSSSISRPVASAAASVGSTNAAGFSTGDAAPRASDRRVSSRSPFSLRGARYPSSLRAYVWACVSVSREPPSTARSRAATRSATGLRTAGSTASSTNPWALRMTRSPNNCGSSTARAATDVMSRRLWTGSHFRPERNPASPRSAASFASIASCSSLARPASPSSFLSYARSGPMSRAPAIATCEMAISAATRFCAASTIASASALRPSFSAAS